MIATGRVMQMEDALGFPVAVKRWNKSEAEKAERELEMMKKLAGEGVPGVIRHFEDAENVFLVTEWISGTTLEEFVELAGGILPKGQALDIGRKIFNILSRFHNNSEGCFVYGDLKPSNIMIKDGNVFLVDFESVSVVSVKERQWERRTMAMGTRPFTAPEIFTGRIGPEADYYSLGIVMFYMLTGELWQGDIGKVEDNYLKGAIEALMNPDPKMRKKGLALFMPYEMEEASRVKSLIVADERKYLTEPCTVFVHNNPRFAIEMAYYAAARMNYRVGIFAVAEFDNPALAESLNIKVEDWPVCLLESRSKEEEFLQNSGIAQWEEQNFLRALEGCPGLYISLIQPSETMRHLEMQEVGLFCKWAKKCFDIAVFIGRVDRDYIAHECDRIVMACKPDIWDVHTMDRESYYFLELRQMNTVGYVAWEYKEGVSMPLERFAERLSVREYIGEIYYDSERLITENTGSLPYCFSMPDVIKQQYERIIKRIIF